MKSLNEDDKETLTILAVFGICIVILSFIAAITEEMIDDAIEGGMFYVKLTDEEKARLFNED